MRIFLFPRRGRGKRKMNCMFFNANRYHDKIYTRILLFPARVGEKEKLIDVLKRRPVRHSTGAGE